MAHSSHLRRGFTLIELMIVMLIIAILSAAMGYVMISATETAKISATRNTIAKIHTLLMQRYESYRYRRLPIQIPAGTQPRIALQMRCDVLRLLMRLEMPDRWSDISISASDLQVDGITVIQPSLSVSYQAAYNNFKANLTSSGHQFDLQSAQCLYMIVTMGLEDNDTLENFSQSEIADQYGTGAKYFVDAWGNPIKFLRWAPGFRSSLQPDPSQWAANDPRLAGIFDQTDPMGIYGKPPATYALYPLIYSAGPDGFYDIVEDAYATPGSFTYTTSTGSPAAPNNPFASVGNSAFTAGSLGTAAISKQDAATGRTTLGNSDDITNHAIGFR